MGQYQWTSEDTILNRETDDRQYNILTQEDDLHVREHNILNRGEMMSQRKITFACIRNVLLAVSSCVGTVYIFASIYGGLIMSIIGSDSHAENPFYIIWVSLNILYFIVAAIHQVSDLNGYSNATDKISSWLAVIVILQCLYFALYFILSQIGVIPSI